MKTMHRLACTVAAAVLALALSPLGVSAQMEKLANTTPQERATMQTQYMTTKLGLTPDQTQSVSALNLKYAQKMDPIIKGSEPPVMKLRQMRQLNEQKDAELKGLLQPPQYEKYLAAKEEMRDKLEQRMEQKK